MTSDLDLCYTPSTELFRMIREKEITPTELVKTIFSRIKELEPKLNTYTVLTEETALKEAKQAEEDIASGQELGPLHGIPFSIKDLVYTKGVKTMRGSKIYENYVPDEDAVLVERLKAAGGIMMGKTTTPEFGHKGMTDSLVSGVTVNPWNTEMTPGGSSGGASSSVAAGMTTFAVGTDGGGSIRNPACFTGIYGLKPSFGRVPIYPASWLDALSHAGPMTRTVGDAALMMNVIAGPDERDPLSLEATPPDYLAELEKGVKGLKAAYSPKMGLDTYVDPEVAALVAKSVKDFAASGMIIEELDDPGFYDTMDVHGPLWLGGLAGMLSDDMVKWEDKMDPLLVSWIKIGQEMSAETYVKAQIKRHDLRQRMRKFFEKYDILLTPTLPITAFKAGVSTREALEGVPIDSTNWSPFSAIFDLTQNPAASIPAGFTKAGMPVGLQIIGPRFADLRVLQASRAFELICPWADKRPEV